MGAQAQEEAEQLQQKRKARSSKIALCEKNVFIVWILNIRNSKSSNHANLFACRARVYKITRPYLDKLGCDFCLGALDGQ